MTAITPPYDDIAEPIEPVCTMTLPGIIPGFGGIIIDPQSQRRGAGCRRARPAVAGITCCFAMGTEPTPRAAALIESPLLMESLDGGRIDLTALALAENLPIPFEATMLQGTQVLIGHAGNDAGGIEILDAKEPATATTAGLETAGQCDGQRAQMQTARGRGSKAACTG